MDLHGDSPAGVISLRNDKGLAHQKKMSYEEHSESGKNAAFFGDENTIQRVFGQGRKAKVKQLTRLLPTVITLKNFEENSEALSSVAGL